MLSSEIKNHVGGVESWQDLHPEEPIYAQPSLVRSWENSGINLIYLESKGVKQLTASTTASKWINSTYQQVILTPRKNLVRQGIAEPKND